MANQNRYEPTSAKWVDRTNYYSLPRPYNKNRDSIVPPQDQPPAKTSAQMHREQILVLPSGAHGGLATNNTGSLPRRPTTISPQRSVLPPKTMNLLIPRHQRTSSADLVKAEVFVHQGANSGMVNHEDRSPGGGSGNWVSPSSEHENHSPTGFHPVKFKKDRFSFYNELLELEKRSVISSDPLYVRLDDTSGAMLNGHGSFHDPATAAGIEVTKNIEHNRRARQKNRNYVLDIAGAHIPVYQRIGGFQGTSRFEVDEQRNKADRMMTNYFVRQSRGRDRGTHFTGHARRERPASAIPEGWDPVVYVGPVTTESKLSAFETVGNMKVSRTDYMGSTSNINHQQNSDNHQPVMARMTRNEQVTRRSEASKSQRPRRSQSAVRPHSAYYF